MAPCATANAPVPKEVDEFLSGSRTSGGAAPAREQSQKVVIQVVYIRRAIIRFALNHASELRPNDVVELARVPGADFWRNPLRQKMPASEQQVCHPSSAPRRFPVGYSALRLSLRRSPRRLPSGLCSSSCSVRANAHANPVDLLRRRCATVCSN